MAIEQLTCDVCGEAVRFDADAEWDGVPRNEPDNPVCSCCYGVICGKHTGVPKCPHEPADHAPSQQYQEASVDDGE